MKNQSMNVDVYKELNKFKHIKYFDEPHKYFIGEQELTSGTAFLGKLKDKFNAPVMAEKTAKKTKRSVEDILEEWDYKRDFSAMKGTFVHSFAENYWSNKIFPYNEKIPEDRFAGDGAMNMRERYDECIRLFKDFYNDASSSLIPIASELVIGDITLPVYNKKGELESEGIAGMVDGLFWNEKQQELQIWDYKTNGKIRMSSDYHKRFNPPIAFIEECEYETYSLQLNLYKYIIEKNTNLKIGKCYLVWLHEENPSYQVIECKEYQDVINLLFKPNK
jgi:ATP-dependent exoDNAse (exonuclease V) beta subunit